MYAFKQFVPALSVAAVFASTPVLPACGGGSSSAAPTSPTPTTTLTPPPGASTAQVADGQVLFNGGSCARCHGTNGRNPTFGPDLTDNVYLHNGGTFDEIIQIVTTGVPAAQFKLPTSQAAFEMFPRGGMNLTDDQVRAVAAYVWALSHSQGR